MKITQKRAAQKMPSETTTACVSLFVFFIIRRGTFPYSVEDDASTISQTPTTHYTNICNKLTIITHPFFSERIAIANLFFFSEEKSQLPGFELTSQRVRRLRGYQLSYRGDGT